MAGIKAKIKEKKPTAIKELIARLKDLPEVVIGFPKGKATAATYPNGVAVIDVAFYNNYGTKDAQGLEHIPPRRFMDIGGKRASRELSEPIKKGLEAVNRGKLKLEDLAELMGLKAVAVMKTEITELSEPPNAPATIAKKKSANPLIDTGLMRQTVTFAIRKKSEK